jgi:DNA-binding transcriptional MocR family regulator
MATKFITVSIEIMHDKNLSPNQKFILAEIHQLCSLESGCFASNRHFSDLIGITTMGVSKALHGLENMGYVVIDNSQSKRNFGRTITINSGKSPINSGKSPINSGKSPINSGKSPINSGLETKENKTINKTNNKDATLISEFSKAYGEPNEKALDAIQRFLKYRRSIKKNVKTVKAIKLFMDNLRECLIAKYSIEEVFELMEAKEWQSIKLEWVQKEITKEKVWTA